MKKEEIRHKFDDTSRKSHLFWRYREDLSLGNEYIFTNANMHAVTNGNSVCSVTSEYQYSVDGTSLCANYNISWNNSAPKKVDSGEVNPNYVTNNAFTDNVYLPFFTL